MEHVTDIKKVPKIKTYFVSHPPSLSGGRFSNTIEKEIEKKGPWILTKQENSGL